MYLKPQAAYYLIGYRGDKIKKGLIPIILIFGIIAFVLFTPVAVSDFEIDLFWSRIDDTVVLTNETNNVNIGENDTTAYKLKVNGTSFFNDTAIFNKNVFIDGNTDFDGNIDIDGDFYIDGEFKIYDTSNDIIITRGQLGNTWLQIPCPTLGTYQIAFQAGSYTVLDSVNTQSISGQKNFYNDITYFAHKLVHSNDANTYMEYTTDNIEFFAGGLSFLKLDKVGVFQAVINDDEAGMEFIVRTDEQAEAFKVGSEPGVEVAQLFFVYDDAWLYGDTFFISDDSGLPYGSFWIHEGAYNVDITGSGTDTYVEIDGWSTGETNLVANNSFKFEVYKVGVYQVIWDISGESDGANKIYEVDIFVNGVEQNSGSCRMEFASANSFGVLSGNGIVDVTSTRNLIDIRMKQVGGLASDFNIFNANLNIVQIGGT